MLIHARVQKTDGLTMMGAGDSNHWLVLDTSKQFGGNDGASLPLEALLISAGSCLGMFITGMFRKNEKQLNGLTIDIVGEKADAKTPYLKKLTLHCKISSTDADRNFVEAILAKGPERSPVLVTLKQGLEVVVHGSFEHV
jgi:uncharacterized OsmC-like protein